MRLLLHASFHYVCLFQAGFCGIPPALVTRYAEELRRDIHDVAHALDETRIKLLQVKKRPWVRKI